jgi:HK97 gp10 family phage protein
MGDITDFKRRARASIEAGRKAGYEAVRKEAREIALAMRRAAPRGSGALQESVRLETVEAKARVLIKAGGPTTTRQAGGKPYDYALGTEWGTVKTPAQPFFYPMWRLHRATAKRRIAKAVKDAVNAAWGGA